MDMTSYFLGKVASEGQGSGGGSGSDIKTITLTNMGRLYAKDLEAGIYKIDVPTGKAQVALGKWSAMISGADNLLILNGQHTETSASAAEIRQFDKSYLFLYTSMSSLVSQCIAGTFRGNKGEDGNWTYSMVEGGGTIETTSSKATLIDDNSTLDDTKYPSAKAVKDYVDLMVENAGGGGGGSSVQSDYLQNDENATDYIKNRPFYEEFQTTTYDPANIIEGEDVAIIPSTALNLTIGDTAQYELLLDGNSVATGSAEVLDGEETGFPGHGFLYIAETINEDDAIVMVIDKLSASLEPSETESITVPPLPNLTIKISSGTVKKIDKKFLPDDIATKLEVATSEVLGGVMPVEKQSSMTQEVGIDENGRLFTSGVKISGTYDASQYTVSCATDGEGRLWAEKTIIPTTSTIEANSDSLPTSAAVYSFIEELLAEGEY